MPHFAVCSGISLQSNHTGLSNQDSDRPEGKVDCYGVYWLCELLAMPSEEAKSGLHLAVEQIRTALDGQ